MLQVAGTSVAMGKCVTARAPTTTLRGCRVQPRLAPHALPPRPALRSAGEGVKAAAQHIVGTNAEDGWVEAMERFVLDRL